MTYLALARKWRPRTFSELVGQEHVSQAIINSLNQQRLHHAYLFTGTRGVGKTSIARLFAKSLNCLKGISAEPCLECEHCLSIENGSFVDLLEVDAASKTGVEDTRQLLDNVQYLPASARFKIYLIDEIHMLSTSSFNALLKTLEEPPAHVKFILATTDPQKMPPTVLSRCLQFHLRHINNLQMVEHLIKILSSEQTSYEQSAVELLAQAAQGSLRDALSLMDQALALSDECLNVTTVKNMLGYTHQDYALYLLQALAGQQVGQIIQYCRQIDTEGGHFIYVIKQIQHYLHQMMLTQQLGTENPLLKPSPELISLAQQFNAQDVQLFYQIALKGAEDMQFAPTLVVGFEVVMLRMLAFRPALPLKKPEKPIEQTLMQTSKPEIVPPPVKEFPSTANKNTMLEDIQIIPDKETIESTKTKSLLKKTDWADILQQLRLKGLAYTAAEHAVLKERAGTEVILSVASGHMSLFTTAVRERIAEALARYYNEKIRLTVIAEQEGVVQTPAIQKQHRQKQALQEAGKNLENDPVFQSLQENFSAKVLVDSIESLEGVLQEEAT